MASYISSNANRFYTALEASYGNVGSITGSNRIPALKLAVKQQLEVANRKDKTGSRTFTGLPVGGRRRTSFDLETYMTSWQKSAAGPAYGPLFQAALGRAPLQFAGGTVASCTADGRLAFAAPHGLAAGQAIASDTEIRFVEAIADETTVVLNVPFTSPPAAGAALSGAVTYLPSSELPSVSVFDYWSPAAAVQRILCGAAVDQMDIVVNGDYHEFHFSGVAQDLLDSSSFSGQVASLESFPAEPALGGFDYSIVPGNMGQAWLGVEPSQFFTITNASVVLKNNLDTRSKEFGSNLPRAIAPGQRSVTACFDLYSQTDTATAALYQAARQQSPITVMFQLGQVAGQMAGVYLKSVIPEVPEFNDSKNHQQWQFRPSHAQGTLDDEIAVAFG